MTITKIVIFEMQGYARVYYSDNSSLIVSIKNALIASRMYNIVAQEV